MIQKDIILLDLAQKESIKLQPEINKILEEVLANNFTPLAISKACSQYIFDNFKYVKGITTIETTVDQVLSLRTGVCQDFAHVLLQLLRTLSIPCRYVSGYICPNKNGMRGEGATHAWVEHSLAIAGEIGAAGGGVVAGSHDGPAAGDAACADAIGAGEAQHNMTGWSARFDLSCEVGWSPFGS